MMRGGFLLLGAWLCFGASRGHAQENLPLPTAPPPTAPAAQPAAESGAGGEAAATREVVKSAMVAVAELGDRVARGQIQYAFERMDPRWKERLAKQNGGMAALEQSLRDLTAQMQAQGIMILSVKVNGAGKAYSVWPKRSVKVVDGKPVESVADSRWVVLVPTVTRMRVRDEGVVDGVPRFRIIESSGFQVAISDKEKIDWFFIDGAGVTVSDLRSLFPTLPESLQLPIRERREVRE